MMVYQDFIFSLMRAMCSVEREFPFIKYESTAVGDREFRSYFSSFKNLERQVKKTDNEGIYDSFYYSFNYYLEEIASSFIESAFSKATKEKFYDYCVKDDASRIISLLEESFYFKLSKDKRVSFKFFSDKLFLAFIMSHFNTMDEQMVVIEEGGVRIACFFKVELNIHTFNRLVHGMECMDELSFPEDLLDVLVSKYCSFTDIAMSRSSCSLGMSFTLLKDV